MVRALAIETSGRIGSIAVVEDGRVVREEQFPHGLRHAAHIIPMIDQLTRQQRWSPGDLEELYVSVGPGSFTGLRIGVTLAKTMALATGVKLVAVPTVRVLVENALAEAEHVIIVLDAKRDQIFAARFERDGDAWIEREPARLDSLATMLSRSPRPVYLLGEGLPHHEAFVPSGDASIIVMPPDHWRARAAAVAKIGYPLARAGAFTDPLALVPTYIRKPEAEEKYDAAKG